MATAAPTRKRPTKTARFADNGQAAAVAAEKVSQPVATKKIAICGRAPSSLYRVPFDDSSWEIWGLSNAAAMGQMKRWHRWFELHPVDREAKHRWPKSYWEWLGKKHDGKVLMIGHKSKHVPHGTLYPWQHILKTYGRYHNNSISLMIAYALDQPGITELAIYGVDMAQTDPSMHQGNPEYQHQRPSCELMIGWAMCKLGIDKVHVPIESDLLKCARIYGLEGYDNALRRKCIARKNELGQRHAQIMIDQAQTELELSQMETNCAKLEGMLEELGRFIKATGDDTPQELIDRREKMKKDQAAAFNNVKVARWQRNNLRETHKKFDGAKEDNDYWMTRLDA